MAIEYDDITAFHYASYRPSLHSLILKRCLGDSAYASGLDIGCGTGQSAVALANFCDTVIGIDPSANMISKGVPHPKLRYQFFDKRHIFFPSDTFSIITLAGSLWYAKSQTLLDEIIRVSTLNAPILIYDFEVLLTDVLDAIGFSRKVAIGAAYNHKEDFSGLSTASMTLVENGFDSMLLQIDASDLAHLILSVKEQYTSLADLYGSQGLLGKIINKLNAITDSGTFDIQVHTFFTLYQKKWVGAVL